MGEQPRTPFRIALVSMPWAIFNRPSIQLGALKGYLETHSQLQVHTFHPYLEIARAIGTDTYRLISGDSWAGEALYSPLLFPEQREKARKLFYNRFDKKQARTLDFDRIQEDLKQGVEQVAARLHNQYDLIGFSVCFNQLFSSLVMAERLKNLDNPCPIVFGGSSCVGEIGASLVTAFPQIDYVVDGEGETVLAALCLALGGHSDRWPQRVFSRRTDGQRSPVRTDEIKDLNTLPVPDYSPYFTELKRLFPASPFIPTLPIEFSRGCWWNKCRFCNLNLQWRHYRSKDHSRCLTEVEQLAREHRCLNFTFTDNALPVKESDLFFRTLAEQKKDYHFFAEIRTITDPEKIRLYRRGGLTSIQVGIEALSTTLLQSLRKGTSCIENIAVMRQSQESGIRLDGNLIVEFPGSGQTEVDETMAALESVLPYHPLLAASFFLGYGSPVHSHPHDYGIRAVTQHPNNQKLFPRKVLKGLTPLIQDYRGDRLRQRKLWKPVVEKIQSWHQFHLRRKQTDPPPLSYRDGGSFLIIRQERINGLPLQHRLSGPSREIYLFCTTIRSFTEISRRFPRIKQETLRTFLHDLVQKYLVFCEQNRYLSLAVHNKNN